MTLHNQLLRDLHYKLTKSQALACVNSDPLASPYLRFVNESTYCTVTLSPLLSTFELPSYFMVNSDLPTHSVEKKLQLKRPHLSLE